MAVDLTPPKDYWEQRARSAETALQTMTQCFAILCDREKDGILIINSIELTKIEAHPVLRTVHNETNGNMVIHHMKE